MKAKQIISYKKLSRELKRLFLSQYGSYYENLITEFKDPRDGQIRKAVSLETDDVFYLVLVDENGKKRKNKKAIIENNILPDNDIEDDIDLPLNFA